MSIFGDILGSIPVVGPIVNGIVGGNAITRATGVINNADQGAANQVLAANNTAQTGISNALNNASAGVNGALNNANTNINQAGQNITDAANSANGTLQGYLNQGQSTVQQAQGQLQPYLNAGAQGATSLQQYAASNPQFTAPTAAQVEATPGYQFQLQQGANALTNQAAARGLDQSGATAAALTQYGQGLAGTYYQNAFNNAQQQFQTNQNATLSNLNSLIGAGQTANNQNIALTGQNGTLLQGLGAPQAANTTNAAAENGTLQQYLGGLNVTGQQNLGQLNTTGQVQAGQLGVGANATAGNFSVNGANATAAGILGSGSASLSALGGVLNSLPGYLKSLGVNTSAGDGIVSV